MKEKSKKKKCISYQNQAELQVQQKERNREKRKGLVRKEEKEKGQPEKVENIHHGEMRCELELVFWLTFECSRAQCLAYMQTFMHQLLIKVTFSSEPYRVGIASCIQCITKYRSFGGRNLPIFSFRCLLPSLLIASKHAIETDMNGPIRSRPTTTFTSTLPRL